MIARRTAQLLKAFMAMVIGLSLAILLLSVLKWTEQYPSLSSEQPLISRHESSEPVDGLVYAPPAAVITDLISASDVIISATVLPGSVTHLYTGNDATGNPKLVAPSSGTSGSVSTTTLEAGNYAYRVTDLPVRINEIYMNDGTITVSQAITVFELGWPTQQGGGPRPGFPLESAGDVRLYFLSGYPNGERFDLVYGHYGKMQVHPNSQTMRYVDDNQTEVSFAEGMTVVQFIEQLISEIENLQP